MQARPRLTFDVFCFVPAGLPSKSLERRRKVPLEEWMTQESDLPKGSSHCVCLKIGHPKNDNVIIISHY